MTEVTRDEVESVIRKLTPRSVRIKWVPDNHDSSAYTTIRGQHIIKFGDELRNDTDEAFFFAAHEAGHIALGHTRWATKMTTIVWFLTAVAAVITTASLLAAEVNPLAGSWAFVGVLLALHLVLRFRASPHELEADDFAQAHGHSIIGVESRVKRTWAHDLLPTHPAWSRRQEHAASTPATRPHWWRPASRESSS